MDKAENTAFVFLCIYLSSINCLIRHLLLSFINQSLFSTGNKIGNLREMHPFILQRSEERHIFQKDRQLILFFLLSLFSFLGNWSFSEKLLTRKQVLKIPGSYCVTFK